MPGASQADAWPTKHSLLTTNYEPKSPSRRANDRSDEKIVIVRGALLLHVTDGESGQRASRTISTRADASGPRTPTIFAGARNCWWFKCLASSLPFDVTQKIWEYLAIPTFCPPHPSMDGPGRGACSGGPMLETMDRPRGMAADGHRKVDALVVPPVTRLLRGVPQ